MAGQIDDTYVAKVLELITSSPTAAELDELLEAYATIGWYSLLESTLRLRLF